MLGDPVARKNQSVVSRDTYTRIKRKYLSGQFELQYAVSGQNLLQIDDLLVLKSLDVYHGLD